MKKLSKEVSREELLQMRENGMTNQQIADSLDISYATVVRYIGAQPKGLRGEYGSRITKVKDEPRKETERQVSLKVASMKTLYQGEAFDYLYTSTGMLKITHRGAGEGPVNECLITNIEYIPQLCKELLDIVWLQGRGR